MTKVTEKILLRKLTSAIGHKITSKQFAFRAQHSITLQLPKLTNQLCDHTNNPKKTAAIFLDVEKAFDQV